MFPIHYGIIIPYKHIGFTCFPYIVHANLNKILQLPQYLWIPYYSHLRLPTVVGIPQSFRVKPRPGWIQVALVGHSGATITATMCIGSYMYIRVAAEKMNRPVTSIPSVLTWFSSLREFSNFHNFLPYGGRVWSVR